MTRCKICRTEFTRKSMTHKLCGSVDCAVKYGEQIASKRKAKEAKDERRNDAATRLRLKTWREWIADTQTAFNRYVRLRDAGKPCISCPSDLAVSPESAAGHGSVAQSGGAYDCGHFRSVGSAPHLRFVELNAHKQCKRCNRYASGNHSAYRLGLVARIGLEAVEALEADQTPRKYTIDELKAMKADYTRRARELGNSRQ
jgi:hypothetical protein